MDTLQIQIRPLSAFGGPVKGDTLFGQLCWAVVHRFGEERLTDLLQGYTEGHPFLICSDAFPHGYIPRPALPLEYYDRLEGEDRKRVKKRQWLPLDRVGVPLESWLGCCLSEQEVTKATTDKAQPLCSVHAQPHNAIHRGLNTTQGGTFAPYTMSQHWFAPGLLLDTWLMFDGQRICVDEISDLFRDIGATGFGRDASIGLGKFGVETVDQKQLPKQQESNAGMTLAPSAPQGLGLVAEHCYYEPFTRFGRHGDRAVLSGRPFKNPVLLANTGAVLCGSDNIAAGLVGQGLGGNGTLSNAISETVHQGYAPCIGVYLKEADA
jgi:CRISPR-associated protein Csm4